MNCYETDRLVSQYCEFHYGDEYFGVANFPKQSVEMIKPLLSRIKTDRVLDLGCAVGRSSFELARYFDHVTAVDYSHKFIDVAQQIQSNNRLQYHLTTQGDLYEVKEVDLLELGISEYKNRIEFHQGDALQLPSSFKQYDLIFCSNLIDRLYDPKTFIEQIHTRMNTHGLLVLLSPYTWLEEYTPKDKWLGGYKKDDHEVYTLEYLQQTLSEFTFLESRDVEFVIKETQRKFQHTISQMSVWSL